MLAEVVETPSAVSSQVAYLERSLRPPVRSAQSDIYDLLQSSSPHLGMQEVVETLHAETLWNHHWEGGKGAGVELAIPKGCGATHSQG